MSAFQIYFGSDDVTTAGDELDVLVVMNPAALITNLKDLVPGGVIIADSDAFTDKNLTRAGYKENPLEDGSLDAYRLISIDITQRVVDTVKPYGLSHKFAVRCKNMWTLGLTMWLFDRSRDSAIEGLKAKFANKPEIAEANVAAINAGHAYGETAELPSGVEVYRVPRASVELVCIETLPVRRQWHTASSRVDSSLTYLFCLLPTRSRLLLACCTPCPVRKNSMW